MYFIKKLFRQISSFYESLSNLIKWFPLIWPDRQWDVSFLYEIIIKKLHLMELYFTSNKPYLLVSDKEKITEEVSLAKDCLIRINNDDYMLEEYSNFLKKFENINDFCEFLNNSNDKDDHKRLANENTKFYLIEKNKDFDVFCNLLKNKSQGWWD